MQLKSSLLALLALGATFGTASTLDAQLLSATGDVLVSSSRNNRVLRLTPTGEQIASYSYTGLSSPRGLIVDGAGTTYLVSQNTNEILVLDRSFGLVRRFSTGVVKSPTGGAIGPNGNLYIAGFSSSNVGEFTPSGTFVRAYSNAQQLSFANCVAFMPDGSFLVASAGNGRIVRFLPGGKMIGSYTGFGLSSTMGIAIWNNEIFAAGGGSSNIVVFDMQGKALREIRHVDMSGPQGVVFTHDGLLVTSSFFNDKVLWFRPDGTHVRTVKPVGSSVPRNLAFAHGVSMKTAGSPILGQAYPIGIASANEPGFVYLQLLSLSQTPGLVFADGRRWGMSIDPLLELSIQNSPIFQNFVGILDASGNARAVMNLPNLAILRGLKIHAGALTLEPASGRIAQLSKVVSWQF